MGDDPKLVWHRGKLAVSFTEGGKRYRYSLGTDDVAVAKAQLIEFNRNRSVAAQGGPVTVATLYQAYIDDRAAEGKDTTRIRDAWKRLAPTFGAVLPSSITNELCRRYARAREGDGVSNGTIHLELGYVRSALISGLGKAAPSVWLPPKPPPREHHLTKAEAERLVAAAKMPHVRLFIILALSTAGRASSILDLTWDRVDFERRRIDLRNPERHATPKGRAITPMNEMAFTALTEAKKAALTPFVVEYAADRVVSIKKGINAAATRAGVECTPHVLRHSAAVWMAEAGVPIPEIGQYLGHTNLKTTFSVYARYSPDYLQNAAKSLEIKTA